MTATNQPSASVDNGISTNGKTCPYYNIELDLPYWNVNLPADLQTVDCPPYLLNISHKDKQQLSTPDALYTPFPWPTVRSLILNNDLQSFIRRPSDLRRYRAFVYKLTQQYGTVSRFMLTERLRWGEPVEARGGMFENAEDIKILKNDWPYGVDDGIVHLVVWTKFGLEDDEDGRSSQETKDGIEAFMDRTFYGHVSRENVIWFRNWSALKSVHAVEHFHVMLYDADPAFVDSITRQPPPQNAEPIT